MKSRRHHLKRTSSEQGLTLVESLVAIVVIAIVLAAIAPPILIAAATRWQNQRVEQATQLARGEIDRIRLLVEQGQYQPADLPPSSTQNPIQNTAAPNSYTSPISATTGSYIDLNPNRSGDEFVVQTFRGQEQTVTVNRPSGTVDIPVAFMMGVRVYSARSFANGAYPTGTAPPTLGLTSGENLQSPLAVLYTPIIRSDQGFSMCKYHKFLNDDQADTCQE